MLFGWYKIQAEIPDGSFEIIEVRNAADHLNVVNFLENAPCNHCLSIDSIQKSFNDTWLLDISVENPFANPKFTAFDVRGIPMFTSALDFPASGMRVSSSEYGDGELLNADGYTSLYNSTTIGNGQEGYLEGNLATSWPPEATVNGYKRHITSDPSNTRNALYAGDKSTVTYHLWLPWTKFIFGYAVDANWASPTVLPVEDPMTDFPSEANSPEPWKMKVEEIPLGGGLTSEGGSTILQIDVYDWQGKDTAHNPTVECPILFDGVVEADFKADGPDYTRYEATIENQKMEYGGDFTCLVRKEAAENDPVNAPWLDLSAWQLINVHVEPILDTGDVSPNQFGFTGGKATAVYCHQNNLFVSVQYGSTHIFDISDPVNPVWLSAPLPGSIIDVVFIDGYMFFSTSDDSPVYVFDIDPIEDVHQVANFGDGSAFSIDETGQLCYVIDNFDLYVYDISDPTAPYEVKIITLPNKASEILAKDGYVYAFEYPRFQIIDVDPIQSAHIVRNFEIKYSQRDMLISDGYLYMGSAIIDIDPPESAHLVTELDNGILKPKLWDGYLADCGNGIKFYDISNPASPQLMYSLPSGNYSSFADLGEKYAYMTKDIMGFSIVDIDPLQAMHYVSTYSPINADKIELGGDLLFALGNPYYDTTILDVTSPSLAKVRSVIEDTGDEFFAYYNGYLYISDVNIQIYDVNDPDNPILVGSLDTNQVNNPVVDNDRLYVTTWYSWGYYTSKTLSIFSLQNPEVPEFLGSVQLNGPRAFDVDGDFAVTHEAWIIGYGDLYEKFSIISVNPPDTPEVVGSLDPDLFGSVSEIEVRDGYAYVTGGGKLFVVDIDPPAEASIVKEFNEYEYSGMYSVPGTLYVVGHEAGIIEIDITNPEFAEITAQYLPGESLEQIIVDGDFVYARSSQDGLRIFKLW